MKDCYAVGACLYIWLALFYSSSYPRTESGMLPIHIHDIGSYQHISRHDSHAGACSLKSSRPISILLISDLHNAMTQWLS